MDRRTEDRSGRERRHGGQKDRREEGEKRDR